jgi:hypothetical protein
LEPECARRYGEKDKEIEKEVAQCIKGLLTQANIEREQVLKYKLGKLEEQKDIYWR